MSASEIRVEQFDSRVLADNPLGDPSRRPVHLVLPAGFEDGHKRYPVTFLLAGFAGSGASFVSYSCWDETVPEILDRLVAQGRARPMILVMPDAVTRFGGSQYLNSTATGRYQDYLLELVEWVDRSFPTIPEREARAVAGKSSGGFGALRLGMDHPEVFGLVADHSGDKYFDYCYYPMLPKAQRAASRMADLAQVLENPREAFPKDQAFRDVMELAALSSCYSPEPAAPGGFEFPVDLTTGETRPAVWTRWRAQDPLERLATSKDALRSLRLLYLDCGRNDEFFLDVGMRLLHRRLEQHQIPHSFQEHDGGHFDLRYRYAFSLEAISRAFG